jgi:hypothetical protein
MRVRTLAVAIALLASGINSAHATCAGNVSGTTLDMPIGASEDFTALDAGCSAVVPDAPLHTVLTYAFTPSVPGFITSAWTATGVRLTAIDGPATGTLTFFQQGSQKSVSVTVPSPFSFGGITKSP